MDTELDHVDLIRRAGAGDRTAWDVLVDRYAGLIWAITRNFQLSQADAGDVAQIAWLRLLENLDRLQDPSRVGAWLATTTRRECLGVLSRSKRTVLVLDDAFDIPSDAAEVDEDLLATERRDAVRHALTHLPPRAQALMRLLMLDPPPSYEEISAALCIPIGSIGPTRGRCLQKLRGLITEQGIQEASQASA